MKRLIGSFIFIIVFSVVTGQTLADSLKIELALSKSDTSRVIILSALSLAYVQSNYEMAMKYSQEGLALARKIKFPRGEADCLRRTGLILFVQGRYPEALHFFQTALNISEKINHSFGIAAGLGHLGNIYFEQGNYPKARTLYWRYLKISADIQNDQEHANALRSIGRSYLAQDQLDSALFYYNRMHELIKNKNYYRLNAFFYSDFGRLQARLGNEQRAMESYRRSIPYSTLEMGLKVLSEAYLGIANLFRNSGMRDSCIYYAQLALSVAQMNNLPTATVEASKLLSEVYEGVNDQLAFKFHKMATAVKDSLFNTEKATQVQNLFFLEEQRRQAEETARIKYRDQLRLNLLLSALGVFLLLAIILYRNNRNKQKANNLLHSQKEEIHKQRTKAEQALEELKATQAQLIQSEKMASLGELTAGIAHEIQNPLNFVNNFSEVNMELIEEMKQEIDKGNLQEAKAIANDVKENQEKINQHGKRADSIVKGMLQHSQAGTGQKEPTDINVLVDEYLRLSFHGVRAKDKSFNATIQTDFDRSIGPINIIPQGIGKVLLNIYNNAFFAVSEKMKQISDTGTQDGQVYEPVVTVTTKKTGDSVEIKVTDNGNGIPQNNIGKIFQPFFTTKTTGQGTGLGLSISYDIIKAHDGKLQVISNEGKGSQFIISL